jgi:hypothetical protein
MTLQLKDMPVGSIVQLDSSHRRITPVEVKVLSRDNSSPFTRVMEMFHVLANDPPHCGIFLENEMTVTDVIVWGAERNQILSGAADG